MSSARSILPNSLVLRLLLSRAMSALFVRAASNPVDLPSDAQEGRTTHRAPSGPCVARRPRLERAVLRLTVVVRAPSGGCPWPGTHADGRANASGPMDGCCRLLPGVRSATFGSSKKDSEGMLCPPSVTASSSSQFWRRATATADSRVNQCRSLALEISRCRTAAGLPSFCQCSEEAAIIAAKVTYASLHLENSRAEYSMPEKNRPKAMEVRITITNPMIVA
mmetsp:Transcript_66676/g.124527  ORF Transcript_66676/g.124527 Transcript_66676/m.124527 type:complete len:222 (-) Transcript_66676:261-926(-)